MPLIRRQFVTIVEFNKLEQRVKKIEDNLGIQTQGRSVAYDFDSDNEEEERDKKFVNLYVEPDLFTDNINSFNKNSIPKHPDLSYAGHKTIIFICIHLHNQVVNQPKKHNTASTSEFGEIVTNEDLQVTMMTVIRSTKRNSLQTRDKQSLIKS
jgi:hypothetical protein